VKGEKNSTTIGEKSGAIIGATKWKDRQAVKKKKKTKRRNARLASTGCKERD